MISLEDLNRALEPFRRGLRTMLSMATISKEQINESNTLQTVQVDLGNDQVIDNVRRIQPFGLSSSLKDADSKAGPETILLSLSGNRDQPIIIQADDSRWRVKVDKGDVALYNSSGMSVHLKGEEIEVSKDQAVLTPLDGVMTGVAIDSLLGVPMGSLPGNNVLDTANSQKLKVEL